MLRKNALSSTSSTDCDDCEGRISLRENQSANAIGRKWPTSITSVAWPLITAEPRMPISPPATSMLRRSSTMLMISSPTHRAAVVGEHQDRLGARGLDADPGHLHQRHQLVAVLHHIAAVGEFDLVGGDLFQPGHQPERHGLGLRRAGAEHQKRGQLLGGAGARSGVLF